MLIPDFKTDETILLPAQKCFSNITVIYHTKEQKAVFEG